MIMYILGCEYYDLMSVMMSYMDIQYVGVTLWSFDNILIMQMTRQKR